MVREQETKLWKRGGLSPMPSFRHKDLSSSVFVRLRGVEWMNLIETSHVQKAVWREIAMSVVNHSANRFQIRTLIVAQDNQTGEVSVHRCEVACSSHAIIPSFPSLTMSRRGACATVLLA